VSVCRVANCRYLAESDFDGFPVCALHDGRHVEAILESLQLPGHYWCSDHPIVLPVGPLAVEHFEPAGEAIGPAGGCPLLAGIDFDSGSIVLPRFDLVKEWEP